MISPRRRRPTAPSRTTSPMTIRVPSSEEREKEKEREREREEREREREKRHSPSKKRGKRTLVDAPPPSLEEREEESTPKSLKKSERRSKRNLGDIHRSESKEKVKNKFKRIDSKEGKVSLKEKFGTVGHSRKKRSILHQYEQEARRNSTTEPVKPITQSGALNGTEPDAKKSSDFKKRFKNTLKKRDDSVQSVYINTDEPLTPRGSRYSESLEVPSRVRSHSVASGAFDLSGGVNSEEDRQRARQMLRNLTKEPIKSSKTSLGKNDNEKALLSDKNKAERKYFKNEEDLRKIDSAPQPPASPKKKKRALVSLNLEGSGKKNVHTKALQSISTKCRFEKETVKSGGVVLKTDDMVRLQMITPRGGDTDDKARQDVQRKRIFVFKEIRHTEESYVRDLTFLAEVVLPQAKETLPFGLFSTIFDPLSEFIGFAKSVWSQLQSSLDGATVFQYLSENLNRYGPYCYNYIEIDSAIRAGKRDSGIKGHFRQLERLSGFRNLGMQDFFILPVQRMCKYPLLLEQLIKCTPQDSEKLPRLEASYKTIRFTVEQINKRMKELEQMKVHAPPSISHFGTTKRVAAPTRNPTKTNLLDVFSTDLPQDDKKKGLPVIPNLAPLLMEKEGGERTKATLPVSAHGPPKIIDGSSVSLPPAPTRLVRSLSDSSLVGGYSSRSESFSDESSKISRIINTEETLSLSSNELAQFFYDFAVSDVDDILLAEMFPDQLSLADVVTSGFSFSLSPFFFLCPLSVSPFLSSSLFHSSLKGLIDLLVFLSGGGRQKNSSSSSSLSLFPTDEEDDLESGEGGKLLMGAAFEVLCVVVCDCLATDDEDLISDVLSFIIWKSYPHYSHVFTTLILILMRTPSNLAIIRNFFLSELRASIPSLSRMSSFRLQRQTLFDSSSHPVYKSFSGPPVSQKYAEDDFETALILSLCDLLVHDELEKSEKEVVLNSVIQSIAFLSTVHKTSVDLRLFRIIKLFSQLAAHPTFCHEYLAKHTTLESLWPTLFTWANHRNNEVSVPARRILYLLFSPSNQKGVPSGKGEELNGDVMNVIASLCHYMKGQ